MKKQKIQLNEWDKITPVPENYSDELEKQKSSLWLSNEHLTSSDHELVLQLENRLMVDDLKNGIQIKTNSYIGVVEFEKFVVSIFPKYLIKNNNLVRLIEYAFDLKHIDIKENELNFEEQNDFLRELLVLFFSRHCDLILKQSLLKRYVIIQNNLSFVRGKLDLSQQLINNMKYNMKFACKYNEFNEDNIENQILLYVLRMSYRFSKNVKLKKSLRNMIYQFSSVISDVSITNHDIDNIVFDRFNQHYENAIQLSSLILNSLGIGEFYSPGKNARVGKTFFINMNDVFEKFLTRLLLEHYTAPYDEWLVNPHKKDVAWKADHGSSISIDPDILLINQENGEKLIVDSKYKVDKITQNDLYQFAFYLSEHNTKRGIAILPSFPDKSNNRYTSYKKGIFVDERRIDINKILNLIYDDSMESKIELRKCVDEILTNT